MAGPLQRAHHGADEPRRGHHPVAAGVQLHNVRPADEVEVQHRGRRVGEVFLQERSAADGYPRSGSPRSPPRNRNRTEMGGGSAACARKWAKPRISARVGPSVCGSASGAASGATGSASGTAISRVSARCPVTPASTMADRDSPNGSASSCSRGRNPGRGQALADVLSGSQLSGRLVGAGREGGEECGVLFECTVPAGGVCVLSVRCRGQRKQEARRGDRSCCTAHTVILICSGPLCRALAMDDGCATSDSCKTQCQTIRFAAGQHAVRGAHSAGRPVGAVGEESAGVAVHCRKPR